MPPPMKCQACRRNQAVLMCSSRDCLNKFCNTCPRCKPGSCKDANHRNMCWDSFHPDWAEDALAHKRCPLDDQVFVNELFHRESDPQKQQELHQADRSALWFIAEPGVVTEVNAGSESSIQQRQGTLYATNRLHVILGSDKREEDIRVRFPSLVCFIGETGAGKSTIIRALIKESLDQMEKRGQAKQPTQAPVVQSGCAENLSDPTSSGVHLYIEPQTFESPNPILFADCEGFNAGGVDAASFPKDLATDKDIITKFPITASSYTTSAQIEDLYSQSLFTFSDCVCFVTRNAQTIGQTMKRLLLWAVKGFGTAIHALPQKSLILVLNGPQSQESNVLMDEIKLRNIFLDKSQAFWEDSPKLNDIVKSVFRDETVTAARFLGLFFNSISVIHIPDGQALGGIHPGDIRLQLRKVHKQIMLDVEAISKIRHQTLTRYNEASFTRLFYVALQHFASSDEVFNFSEATKHSSLGPRKLHDHIQALRTQFAHSTWENVLARFPPTVASALVNRVLVDGTIDFGTQVQWDKFQPSCEEAIGTFYKRVMTCRFKKDGKQCVNTYELHGKTHKCKDGGILGVAVGDNGFHPNLERLEVLISLELAMIKTQFETQYVELLQDETLQPNQYSSRVIEHRRRILSTNYDPVCPLKSYRTCFACIHAIPDHVLPCGHAFCEKCVIDFGEALSGQPGAIKITRCMICGEEWDGERLQTVQTKPDFAGIRILTLDGGGVRGILQVAILSTLSDMIGLDLHISQFFDLMVGTGTGGLIALGVGLAEMRLVDIENKFTTLAIETFSKKRGENIWSWGLLAAGALAIATLPVMFAGALLLGGGGLTYWHITQSNYSTLPLQTGLQGILGTATSMLGSPIRHKKQRSTRVAVLCMKDGTQLCAIANYNRPLIDSLPPIDSSEIAEAAPNSSDAFERAENEDGEIKAWEAALATTAAVPDLKPFTKQSVRATTYVASGLGPNNPVFWATEEHRKLWDRPGAGARLDILLSLGSGIFSKTFSTSPAPPPPADSNPVATHEPVWSDFMRTKTQYSGVFHRLNVHITERCPQTNFVGMDGLVHEFHRTLLGLETSSTPGPFNRPLSVEMNLIAHLLVAKLFFFEPVGPILLTGSESGSKRYLIRGKIFCRLPQASSALKAVVNRVVAFFAVENESEGQIYQIPASETRLKLSSIDVTGVKAIVEKGGKFEINHSIITSNPETMFQTICVELQHAAEIPQLSLGGSQFSEPTTLTYVSHKLAISGFPCKISELSNKPAVVQATTSSESWADLGEEFLDG